MGFWRYSPSAVEASECFRDILTLGKSFNPLHDWIRTGCCVADKSADFQANGSDRTISVTAEKDGKPLQVRARKGWSGGKVEPRSKAPEPFPGKSLLPHGTVSLASSDRPLSFPRTSTAETE
jgi:hypothetical protein